MLTIRDEQLRVLNAGFLRKFEHNAALRLAQTEPAKCAAMGEQKALELVREAIALGDRVAVEYEDDVETLAVVLARLYPARIQETPWAMKVLEDRSLAPDARVGLLEAMTEHKKNAAS